MIVRYRCKECEWTGTENDLLWAPNPFADDDDERITGCPECRGVESMERLCDVDGCKQLGTCGTSWTDRYWTTCYEHRPSNKSAA